MSRYKQKTAWLQKVNLSTTAIMKKCVNIREELKNLPLFKCRRFLLVKTSERWTKSKLPTKAFQQSYKIKKAISYFRSDPLYQSCYRFVMYQATFNSGKIFWGGGDLSEKFVSFFSRKACTPLAHFAHTYLFCLHLIRTISRGENSLSASIGSLVPQSVIDIETRPSEAPGSECLWGIQLASAPPHPSVLAYREPLPCHDLCLLTSACRSHPHLSF